MNRIGTTFLLFVIIAVLGVLSDDKAARILIDRSFATADVEKLFYLRDRKSVV